MGLGMMKAIAALVSLHRTNGVNEIVRHIYQEQIGVLPVGKKLTITFALVDDQDILLDGHPVDMEIVAP